MNDLAMRDVPYVVCGALLLFVIGVVACWGIVF